MLQTLHEDLWKTYGKCESDDPFKRTISFLNIIFRAFWPRVNGIKQILNNFLNLSKMDV